MSLTTNRSGLLAHNFMKLLKVFYQFLLLIVSREPHQGFSADYNGILMLEMIVIIELSYIN